MEAIDTIDAPQVDDNGQQTPPPQNGGDDDKKLRALHDAVAKDYDIGSFEDFKKNLQDPQKRQSFYNTVGKDYDLGDYNSFQKNIGITPPPEHQIVHTDEHNLNFIGGAAAQRQQEVLNQHQDNAIDELTGEMNRQKIAESMQPAVQKQDAVFVSKMLPDVRFKEQKDAERENYKQQMNVDPTLQQPVLNKIAQRNPDIAPQIKADRYKTQAVARGADVNTIVANANAIQKGDLDYNLNKDQLQKPTGFWDSMVNGWNNRQKDLEDYNYYSTHNASDNIAKLEQKRISTQNPDVAVPTPTSTGKLGEWTGSDAPALGRSLVAAGGVSLLGAPEAAPAAMALVSSPEYYKRGFKNSLEYHYSDLRSSGMNPQDAYTKAYDLAGTDAKIDVAANAAGTMLGGRLGVKNIELTPELRSTMQNVIAKTGAFAKEGAQMGGINVATGITSQVAKNLNAGKPAFEGIDNGLVSNFALPFMLGAVMKGAGKLVDAKTYSTIASALKKMPPEVIDNEAAFMKQDGTATDQDIANLKTNLQATNPNDAKIPIHVTDPEVRQKVSDLMDDYDEEKKKLDIAHDINKPTIKARMSEIQDKANELMGTEPQENIRTKKVDFDKTAVAKDLLNTQLQEGKEEWTKNDMNRLHATNNPEEFLNFISEQDRGQMQNPEGNMVSSSKLTREGFGDDLTDAANEHVDYQNSKPKEVEGVDRDNPKTIVNGESAPSSIPQHENISTDKNLRTLDYGDFKGQKEDDASDKQIKEDILNDVPVGKSGEKFSDFIKRSIPAVQKVIEDPENNSVVVTHSSVLKAMKVWEQMGRPDVNELQGGKLQEFAQKYNDLKPEKEGQVEVLKGNNGTATQLVRHGETEDNKISDFREDNTQLTDRGMSQAKKSGQEIKRMTNGDVTKIVSSDLPRTVHTSNLIMDEVKGTNENNNINQQEQQPSTEQKTGNGEPPTGEESKTTKSENEPNEVGISHDALNKLSKRLGLPEVQRGEVMEPKHYAMMGRIMLKDGVNPNEVLNSNIEPHEKASIARAYLEQLVNKSDEARESGNEQEYNKIGDEISAFNNNVIKKLGTQWAELGRSLQGKTDLNTGSFTSVKTAVEAATGKPATPEQKARVTELTAKNKELTKKLSDSEAKLTETTDKAFGIKEKGKPQRERLSTQLTDLAKRLRTSSEFDSFLKGASGDVQKMGVDLPKLKEIAASILEDAAKAVKAGENAIDFIRDAVSKLKEDVDKDKLTDAIHAIGEKAGLFDIKETPEEKNIKRLEKQLSDLQEGNVKQQGIKREYSEKEKELQDQIFEEKQKLGLVKGNSIKGKKSLSEADLLENAKTSIERGKQQQLADEKELAAKFVNHSGDKFTTKEASDIWGYMKEHYIDKGTSYRDALISTSNDLGLTFNQVSKAIVDPKTEPISNEMWKRQYDLEKNRLATQRYVDTQGRNQAIRAFKKVANVFREEVVFGHGGVFVGTHAGMTLMDLPRAKYTLKAFFNAYKFAYPLGKDGIANYQKAMTELKASPNYALAQRSGLRNNPDVINNDAEIIAPIFGKFSESGKRGFNAIKVLRQDLFDAHFNARTGIEQKDPGTAVSIVQLVNNATGATNLKLPNWVNEVTFAGGMEAARWGKLTSNPLQATKTAIKALVTPDKATTEERVFAKVWAKRVGWELGTYSGLILANAGLQSMATDDKSKQVNLTDPTKSDWLKPKIGNTTFDFTSGMLSTTHFVEQVLQQAAFPQKQDKRESVEEREGKTLLKYGQGKLSPFYGDVTEVAFQHDYSGNTLPWSNAKPEHAYNHKMTWEEYASSKLPLPVAEGFRAFYESANKTGMPKAKLDDYLNGVMYGIISGTTGFRAYETSEPKKGGTGGGGGYKTKY